MNKIEGISDVLILLTTATTEALSRCNYDGRYFYPRVGGVKGFARLLMMPEKEIKMKRGVGAKTWEAIQTVKKVIIERVAQSALETIETREKEKKVRD